MSITVFGHSDDLIEIEGDLREEFTYKEHDNNYLAFSDGTLLDIQYNDEGIWRIHKLAQGDAVCVLSQGTDSQSDYTDRMVLQGEGLSRWVVHGVAFSKR